MGAVALSGQDLAVLREQGPAGLRGRDRDPFWLWLAGCEFKPSTMEEYYKQGARFRRWLVRTDAHPDAYTEEARDAAVADYLAGLQPAAHNVTLAAVTCLYESMGLGPVQIDAAEKPPVVPDTLSELQESRTLEAAAGRSARDYALTTLLLDVGPTSGELRRLDLDDLEVSARAGSVRLTNEDGEVRELELTGPTCRVMLGWRRERKAMLGRRNERALFITLQRRHRIEDSSSLRKIVVAIGEDAGLARPPLTPERLRATVEARLLREGMDPKELAARMGVKHVNAPRVRALLGATGALSARVQAGPVVEQLSLDFG